MTTDTNGAGGLPSMYLLVHHAEPGDLPDFTWCDGRGALYDAVSAAVFVDGPEDDDQREEVSGITDELIRTGWFRFEGDPPLQLLTAPGKLCRATREGDGEAEIAGAPKHWGDVMRELEAAAPDELKDLVFEVSYACDQRLSFLALRVRELEALLRTLSRVAVQEGMVELQRFAAGAMQDWWNGDLDGGERQELAEKCGLLIPTEVAEACGEDCNCTEYGEFPMTCYRPSEILKHARAIAAAQRQEGGSNG